MAGGPTLLISAGEPSGDRHAARFLEAFRRRHPGARAVGLGGPELRAQGLEPLARMEELAVVGLVEVLGKLPAALRALGRLVRAARERPVDLVVPVDFPDFNLRLARRVRRLGLPVLYYISPQVWAWREGRIRAIERDVDRMAVVFPFEVDFYRERASGLRVDFVGHPLLEEMPAPEPHGAFRQRHGIPSGAPLVALFPGSRESEVARHWPLLVETARRVHRERPEARFASALAPGIAPERHAVPAGVPIRVVRAEEHRLLQAADAAAVAAGTATLEALLAGCPMVVFYRVTPLTYALMRRAVRVPRVALANLVGGAGVARELLQQDATPEALAAEVLRLLDDRDAREAMRRAAEGARVTLAGGPASEGVARIATEMMEARPLRGATRAREDRPQAAMETRS